MVYEYFMLKFHQLYRLFSFISGQREVAMIRMTLGGKVTKSVKDVCLSSGQSTISYHLTSQTCISTHLS